VEVEMDKKKRILLVDDSDIDRMMLNAMLCDQFDVIQKCGGFTAVDFLKANKNNLDVVLLDISMPVMGGFDVLKVMKEEQIINLPVILITSEATRDNVLKARQFGVSGFLKKPFDREEILARVRQQLGIIVEYELTNADIRETFKYISELEMIFKRYLINFGEKYEHYLRIKDLMKIMLTQYSTTNVKKHLDETRIEIISKAGFFCDIGNMIVPPETIQFSKPRLADRDGYQNHTLLGAELIKLNHLNNCKYFIEICSDICTHHHERYDGKGYPHKIIGESNLIYTQICRLADKFDLLFYRYKEHNQQQFDLVFGFMKEDKGFVSENVIALLADCKMQIVNYYQSID